MSCSLKKKKKKVDFETSLWNFYSKIMLKITPAHSRVAFSKPDKQNKISSSPVPNNFKLEGFCIRYIVDVGQDSSEHLKWEKSSSNI